MIWFSISQYHQQKQIISQCLLVHGAELGREERGTQAGHRARRSRFQGHTRVQALALPCINSLTSGYYLILQVCFLICKLGVITIVPTKQGCQDAACKAVENMHSGTGLRSSPSSITMYGASGKLLTSRCLYSFIFKMGIMTTSAWQGCCEGKMS